MNKFIFYTLVSLILSFNAFASPLYTTKISVDVTDENVAIAKQKALQQAQREGLNNVILAISTQKTVDQISLLNDKQIEHFISGIQVLMEKSSDVRYIADLEIEINKDVLNAYIKENDLPIIITEAQNALLIPVLEQENKTHDIWGNDNFWREAFITKTNLHNGVLNFHNIEKNLGNISNIDANTIFDMSPEQFAELSSFNRVEQIIVLKYSINDKKIYTKSFPSNKVIETNFDETDTPSLLIDKILPQLKGDKKQTEETSPSTTTQKQFDVLYTYPNLGKWMTLKRLLESNPMIDNIKIISMANKKVHFNFTYYGVLEKLQSTLTLNGYNLKDNGEYYVIN